jgi:hypothetical protein
MRETTSDKRVKFLKQVNRAYCHHDGTAAILKARTQRGLPDRRSMILDKLARRHVLRTALLRSISIADWLRDGTAFGEEGLSLELDKHMVQVAQVQQDADEIKNEYEATKVRNKEDTKDRVQQLLQEVRRLVDEMSSWQVHLSSEWSYTAHVAANATFTNLPYCNKVHTYQSPIHPAIWNRVRTVQILLRSTEISLLSFSGQHLGLDLEHRIEVSRKCLQGVIEEVCASIPYCLDDYSIDVPHENGVAAVAGHRSQRIDKAKENMIGYLAFPLHAIVLSLGSSGLPDSH